MEEKGRKWGKWHCFRKIWFNYWNPQRRIRQSMELWHAKCFKLKEIGRASKLPQNQEFSNFLLFLTHRPTPKHTEGLSLEFPNLTKETFVPKEMQLPLPHCLGISSNNKERFITREEKRLKIVTIPRQIFYLFFWGQLWEITWKTLFA